MESKNIAYIVSILGVVIIIAIVGYFFIYRGIYSTKYYAVFLNNGVVYFGKLSTFPKLRLDNAVFFQFDQSGQITGVNKFNEAVWQPEGPIYLNRNSISFIAPISQFSPLINLIEGRQDLLRQQPQPQSQPSIQPQQMQINQNQFQE